MENSMTVIEQSELSRLEAIIKKGQQTFIEVGAALMEIRDSGLYKMYGTFERYCKERWEFSIRQAQRLIASAKTIQILETRPTGRLPNGPKAIVQGIQSHRILIPTSERQTRPLSHLEPAQQQEAWKEAVDTAPEGKVTAKHVEGIVRIMTESPSELKEIEEDSDALFQLKKWWKRATKKDKTNFIKWSKNI